MRKAITFGLVVFMILMGFVALATPIASDGGGCQPVPVITKTAKPYCGWFTLDAVPLHRDIHYPRIGVGYYEVAFYFTVTVTNPTSMPMTDVVVKDNFGGELEVDVIWECTHGWPVFVLKGATEKVQMTWEIGTLQPGETATLYMRISTDINPGGQHEYTSPGIHYLNSGATIKYFIDGHKYTMTTPVIPITVVEGWYPGMGK